MREVGESRGGIDEGKTDRTDRDDRRQLDAVEEGLWQQLPTRYGLRRVGAKEEDRRRLRLRIHRDGARGLGRVDDLHAVGHGGGVDLQHVVAWIWNFGAKLTLVVGGQTGDFCAAFDGDDHFHAGYVLHDFLACVVLVLIANCADDHFGACVVLIRCGMSTSAERDE